MALSLSFSEAAVKACASRTPLREVLADRAFAGIAANPVTANFPCPLSGDSSKFPESNGLVHEAVYLEREPGESRAAFALRCRGFTLGTESVNREDRSVSVAVSFNPYVFMRAVLADWQARVLDSDKPGIAAAAAKPVQPTPEPVLSVAGEQVTEREIAQALALLRGQNAPAVKETPRGLGIVAAIDHRGGRWNEA